MHRGALLASAGSRRVGTIVQLVRKLGYSPLLVDHTHQGWVAKALHRGEDQRVDPLPQRNPKGHSPLHMEHPHEGVVHQGYPVIILELEWCVSMLQLLDCRKDFPRQFHNLAWVRPAEQVLRVEYTSCAILLLGGLWRVLEQRQGVSLCRALAALRRHAGATCRLGTICITESALAPLAPLGQGTQPWG